MNKCVTSDCILPLQCVVLLLPSGSTIINNDFQVSNMAKKSLGAEELVALIRNLNDIELEMVSNVIELEQIEREEGE